MGRCLFPLPSVGVSSRTVGRCSPCLLWMVEGRDPLFFLPVGSLGWAGHMLLILTSSSLEKLGLLLQAPGLRRLRPVITARLIITTPGQGYKRLPLTVWGENLKLGKHLISMAALLNVVGSYLSPRKSALSLSSKRQCVHSTLRLTRGARLKGIPVSDQVNVLKGRG